ncbi:tail assembly protein [Orbus sasakiae]|uniref:Tail assembly protein n=1 Tax=Orbus sasakiae TaxID=1078475 RepID=A0ABP9N0R1_9GAMM
MAIIKFYGNLKQYGDKYKISADTAAEALNCLYIQVKGLKQDIMNGYFRVRVNKKDISEKTVQFGLRSKIPQDAVIHIVPATTGAKNGGVFQVIAGAVLFVAGAVISYVSVGTLAQFGVSMMFAGAGMMLGGVAQMLTKTPKLDHSLGESGKKSTSFSSLSNTIAQGAPIPLIYGQVMVGSKVLSQGLETMDTE